MKFNNKLVLCGCGAYLGVIHWVWTLDWRLDHQEKEMGEQPHPYLNINIEALKFTQRERERESHLYILFKKPMSHTANLTAFN